jgi:hypothetical protein
MAPLRIDDGDDIAALTASPVLEPLDERAGFHVGAECRHAEFGHRDAGAGIKARTASTIVVGCGSAASSRCFGYGIGTSAEQTRATGASRS